MAVVSALARVSQVRYRPLGGHEQSDWRYYDESFAVDYFLEAQGGSDEQAVRKLILRVTRVQEAQLSVKMRTPTWGSARGFHVRTLKPLEC